jgi:serine/threonine-protein kinase
VFLGRLFGDAGFERTVAIKKLHPHVAKDPEFVAMFVEEARLASRVQHPNVCNTLDVVNEHGELMLVLDYVHGESLARLLRTARAAGEHFPISVTVGVLVGVLDGLHAAHEAKSVQGTALDIVHRDVSPQNIMLGPDGVPRVLDFGIAKATHVTQTTRDGQLKGKISYMAPEQIRSQPLDRRADIYAAGVVLWELLTGERFTPPDAAAAVHVMLERAHDPPSVLRTDVPPALDAVVMCALARDREERFATAREMANALELAVTPASARRIGEWARQIGGPAFDLSATRVADVEARGSPASNLEVPGGPRISQVPTTLNALASEGESLTSDQAVVQTFEVAPVSGEKDRRPAAAAHTRLRSGVAVLLGGAVLAAIVIVARGTGANPPPAGLVGTSRDVPVAPSGMSRAPVAAPTPDPGEQPTALPQVATPPSSAAPPIASTPTKSVRPKAAVAPAPCSPPFTITNGVKRFKPECL